MTRDAVKDIPAQDAEDTVIDAVRKMTLAPRAIDEARRERARRLDVPNADLVGGKRRRLDSRLARLVQLLVERVQATGRTVEPESIEWTPPAAAVFSDARSFIG